MAGIGKGFGFGLGGGKKYDPLASAYFAAVPNSFDAARKTIINTLIAGLRADGNLTKLDRLWLFANTTTGNAVIDVIGLNSATLVNAPAFVADQGYTGDGATSYIDSNYNPATNATNFSINSNSTGVYVRTNVSENFCEFGGVIATNRYLFYSRHSTSGIRGSSFQATDINVASSDSRGLNAIVRTASNAVAIYKNGASVVSAANASTAIDSLNTYILGVNSNGTPLLFSNKQVAIFFNGSGAINQATFRTRIQTYMTSLGTQV